VTPPPGRTSKEIASRLNPGESRSSHWQFVAGELVLIEAAAITPPASGRGASSSRRLTLSANEKTSLRRRVSDDGLVRLMTSVSLRNLLSGSDPKHGRSFGLRGTREVARQTKNGETYTVESLAIDDSAGPAATVLLFKRAGRMVTATKIARARRDAQDGRGTVVTVVFDGNGALEGVTLTETWDASSQLPDVSAVHLSSRIIEASYSPKMLACENEVLAFDLAMGAWVEYQVEMAIVAAACETTLLTCAAWLAMHEFGVGLDIALAAATAARDNCMHQLSNDRSGGSVGSDGKFCYLVYYIETWDGWASWEVVDVQEHCEPIYEI
jgi:hypothetical protein